MLVQIRAAGSAPFLPGKTALEGSVDQAPSRWFHTPRDARLPNPTPHLLCSVCSHYPFDSQFRSRPLPPPRRGGFEPTNPPGGGEFSGGHISTLGALVNRGDSLIFASGIPFGQGTDGPRGIPWNIKKRNRPTHVLSGIGSDEAACGAPGLTHSSSAS